MSRTSRRIQARRRRLAHLALTTVTAVLLVVIFVGGGFSGRSAASREAGPRRITVASGDTLWDLAESHAPPGVDPRAYVDALIQVNELRGNLYPGQRLRLPR